MIIDADTTDVDGNHMVTDDIERLQIIGITPIVNKDYDPTCMVSFVEGMIRHMKIDEWKEDADIWTQGDDVFIIEALMQRADCVDKGVITEVITFRGGPGSPPTNHGASISPYSYRPARRPIPLTIEEIIAIGHYFLACK